MKPIFIPLLSSVLFVSQAFAEAFEGYSPGKLVAWCIVPFDAEKRGPEARAQLLIDLGIKRCAYDWRAEHVPTFEAEIQAYAKHGIEFFAFWGEHEDAFALFQQYGLTPQIWQTAPIEKRNSKLLLHTSILKLHAHLPE